MRRTLLLFICSIIICVFFFWKTILKGLLPIPLDALVGLYHPFRDYFSSTNPRGVAYKNFILTDPVLQQYPWKWLAMEYWKQGKIPWENPYNFSGTPLLANIQAGVFYPLNVVFFFSQFPWMWSVFIILQPILAMSFMALWLRQHQFTIAAQLFGGLVWAFSSFNLVWMEWGNIGHAGLWLPLALLCIDKMKVERLEMKNNVKWHVLFLLSLMSSLFAGHLQITFYLLLAATCYWLLCLGITKRSLTFFIFHFSFFIFLTSIQWIPSLQFTLSSNRDVEQQDVLSREGFFIHPKQLIQIVVPDFFGNPATLNYRGKWNYAEQIIYIGVLPLFFSLIGILSAFQKQNVGPYKVRHFSISGKFALILVVFGYLFSVDTPLARLPYILNVPFLSELQPTRLSYLTTFGLSSLAAIGLEKLLRRWSDKTWTSIWGSLGAIATVLLFSLILSSKFSEVDRLVSQRNLIFPAFVFMTLFIFGFILLFVRSNHSRILLFIVYCSLFTAADLFRFGWKFTPFSEIQYLYPVTSTIQFLQNQMRPNDRFMTLDRKIFPPNANIMYQLKSINGYDPIYSKDYALQITEMESGKKETVPAHFGRIIVPMNYQSPMAKDLNVRYVLSLTDVENPLLQKVFQEGETRIYRLSNSNQ